MQQDAQLKYYNGMGMWLGCGRRGILVYEECWWKNLSELFRLEDREEC
jgi:hypothetical protein